MQSSNWAPAHCAALRDFLARGMSYSEAAEAINARFRTAYTRNAAIGRGKRMGLVAPDRQEKRLTRARKTKAPSRAKPRERRKVETRRSEGVPTPPAPTPPAPAKLRCVGIAPRLLSFGELGPGDCRYPYGGDKEGEAITFCGHPRRAGASYCTPHFHLTRGVGTASERAAGPVMLRLVQAA
jgi:GcrA cell cycle regulator